jgi:DnaK suppressor protein
LPAVHGSFPLEYTVPYLTDDDILQFAAQLRRQRDTVQETIRQRLHQDGDPGQLALANHFSEVREAAQADLQGEIDLGQLQIELTELQDIDAALARVAARTFGACAKCGARISLRRLRARPAARMCLTCQETLERHRLPPAG